MNSLKVYKIEDGVRRREWPADLKIYTNVVSKVASKTKSFPFYQISFSYISLVVQKTIQIMAFGCMIRNSQSSKLKVYIPVPILIILKSKLNYAETKLVLTIT